MISKEDIFNFDDLQLEPVPVPEWGGMTVYLRPMTGAEREQYESRLLEVARLPTIVEKINAIHANLVFLCACNEAGERLFTEKEDFDKLMKKNWLALDRLIDKAKEINVLTDEAVSDLAKKSGPSGTEGSTSG